MDDWKLLREYADCGSEAAFQGLVDRHVNMVYSAALRQLRDSHLAQDVTQAVFILLARKATSLRSSVLLSGWLYRTTSHVASRAMRDRIRQQRREEEASMMIANEPVEELWGKLEPHLDAAISTLGDLDRNAVVLRFLQQRSFREVAGTLGVSEDAAKKRVTRALEKLRATLTARGIAVTGTILATTLGAKAVAAAPASVAAAAMSAVGTGVASATATSLAGIIARQWFLTRLKWAAMLAGGAALVVLVATQTDIFKTSTMLPQKEVVEAASTSTGNSAASEEIVGETATPASPTNPRTMRLKVVSSKDGAALADAVARIVFYGTKSIIVTTAADTNGVMDITRPERKFEGMAYWVAASGHVPKCLSWKREEALSLASDYEVRLDPGVRVSGRAVDEGGQPVAGATLRFNSEGMQGNARDYVDYRYPAIVPTSDAQGQWTVDFLAARPQVWGYVKHPDYAETELSFSMTDGGTSNVIITIQKGAPVSGIVLGTDHEPLPDAKLTVDWQYSNRDEIKTTTDRGGRFSFAHVTPGRFRLNTSAEGYHSSEQWNELSVDGLILTNLLRPIKIAGNATLRGQVVDEAGSPIAGVGIHFTPGQAVLDDVSWSAVSDDEGRFTWNQAPEGSVRLNFTSWHYEHLNNIELTSGDIERVVTMKAIKTSELRCTVIDKTSGQPISRFKVMHGTRDTRLPQGFYQLEFAGEGVNGFFAFPWRPDDSPKYIRPVVRVEAEGYEPETVTITNATESGAEVIVQLEPANDLEGVVLTRTAIPASGAQVALVGGNLKAAMQQPARFSSVDAYPYAHRTIAKSDGSFRLPARKEGDRLLIVHEEGWAIVLLSGFSGGSIYLQPWGRIEGTLWIGQQPAVDAKISVHSDYGRADTIAFSFNAQTDAEGRFQFDKVAPGPVEVSRRMLTPFSRNGSGAVANTQQKRIEIKAGETAHVTLGGTGVQVRGRIVTEPSRADAVLELTAQNLRPVALKPDPQKPPTGYGFFCQPDGSFVVEDVPPGDYVLETRVSAVKNRLDPEASLRNFRIGERNVEVVIPDNQSEPIDLGEIRVPVKNDPLPQGVR